jgi:hypothetical protein
MKLLALAASLFMTTAALAESTSAISIPITARIDALQNFANAQLPVDLDRRRQGLRCVKPKEVCTKVPEFRGLKVTMKNRCVEVTPAIDCDVDHHVWRQGAMSLSASGNQITIKQALGARATVRGRGEIGRHIRETANGLAEFTIVATPSIKTDWTPALDVSVSHRWINRPQARLFGFIPVTFGGEAEKAINDAIATFRNETLPNELAKLKLRDHVAAVWQDIQEPIELPLPEGDRLFLHLNPKTVGISSIVARGNALEMIVGVSGKTQVTDTAQSPFASRTSLPDITRPGRGRLSINVPISVNLTRLGTRVSRNLPRDVDFDGHEITLNSLRLFDQAGKLGIRLDVRLRRFGVDLYDGPLKAAANLRWDQPNQTLTFGGLAFVPTGGIGNSILVALANSRAFRNWFDARGRTGACVER